MSTKPYPLWLADELESGAPVQQSSAAELRLLHEVNQELLEALKEAVCEIVDWGSYASEYFQNKHDLKGAISRATAAINKATGEQA